jgi:hypothetical protein
MASPGAAVLSIQRSPRVPSQKALVVGVMTLIAALALFLLHGSADMTAAISSAREMLSTHPEPAHPATFTRMRHAHHVPQTSAHAPTASRLFETANGSWPSSTLFAWVANCSGAIGGVETRDLRREIAEMATSHWRQRTPGRSSNEHGDVDSDDRIASALFDF